MGQSAHDVMIRGRPVDSNDIPSSCCCWMVVKTSWGEKIPCSLFLGHVTRRGITFKHGPAIGSVIILRVAPRPETRRPKTMSVCCVLDAMTAAQQAVQNVAAVIPLGRVVWKFMVFLITYGVLLPTASAGEWQEISSLTIQPRVDTNTEKPRV